MPTELQNLKTKKLQLPLQSRRTPYREAVPIYREAGGLLVSLALVLSACSGKIDAEVKRDVLPIMGTWKLYSATLIEKGDTTITDYSKNRSFIKIINNSHFAFIQHDVKQGKDSTASFSSGAGTYELKDKTYTEHLEYCSDRQWEGHDFTFNITIKNDTLVQSGVEVVESAGINRLNIEKYVRVKESGTK